MPIRVCENGHLTGFRHCGTCGTANVAPMLERGPMPGIPHEVTGEEFLAREIHRAYRSLRRVRIRSRVSNPPFKSWRLVHFERLNGPK